MLSQEFLYNLIFPSSQTLDVNNSLFKLSGVTNIFWKSNADSHCVKVLCKMDSSMK